MRLLKRAETIDRQTLVKTFVDVGSLFTVLSTIDHQIVYGRRGTGKTHALMYLAEAARNKGDISMYVDLRTTGSTSGVYSDQTISFPERATRLLMDTLAALHEELLREAVEGSEDHNLAVLGPLLDSMADDITQVFVEGPVEHEQLRGSDSSLEEQSRSRLAFSGSGLTAALGSGSKQIVGRRSESRLSRSGPIRHRVHFGAVGNTLRKIADAFAPRRIWLLIDEWSVVPVDLQPYLADLIRRSFLPARGFTVKIGAIEHRSNFQLAGAQGEYLGIEVGADVSANIHLDDFMVFDNDPQQASDFFERLLFSHFKAVADSEWSQQIDSPRALTKEAFTRRDAFEEFVRATEGVPRDGINIVALAAQTSPQDSISMGKVRSAAKTWYQRDKHAAVAASREAQALLHKIIDEVIGHRRARAFLLQSGARHPLVDDLFDKRVLHVLKKNVSAHDQPGVRYDVYKIDFGCYVDLLTTARSPQGLLPFDTPSKDGSWVEVPPDDYRAIRRAILEIDQLGVARSMSEIAADSS